MSQQNQKVTVERKTQMQQSYIETGGIKRAFTNVEFITGSQQQHNVQYDSQVVSLIDSIIYFIKSTFLSSKSNFALLVLSVLYLFSNWSITLQNKKGYSIDIIDVLFIILLIIVVRCWLSGEGFGSIFELISVKTQQVINLTQQGLNQQGQGQGQSQFQQLFKFVSSTPNVRKLETAEQLFERYNKEKFPLSEQTFLDIELVNKLSPQAEQQLIVLIQEYQNQFNREVPFNIKDIDINSLPSNITTEEDFRTKVLNPHYEAINDYVKCRYGFDYNLQNPMLISSLQNTNFNNTLPALASDLSTIEKDLLLNRSQPIFAYSNNKHQLFNNRLSSFFNEDSNNKLQQFRQKHGISGSEEISEQVDFVFGNQGAKQPQEVVFQNKNRQEVELQKFVGDAPRDQDHKVDALESLVLADKLIERQGEVEQEVKSFKKQSKKNMIDGAASQKNNLNGLIETEENNQESEITKSEPEEAIKKLDVVLTAKIEQILKDTAYIKFTSKSFETYFDNALEEQMKSESNSQVGASKRNNINQLLSKEISGVLQPESVNALSLFKYLELVTKYEYFADSFKDESQVLTKIQESFENYVKNTYNLSSQTKQQRRLRVELTSIKNNLLQEYLLRRFKKQLTEIEAQSNQYQQQLAKLTEKSDLKDRKIGLLEEQVTSLQTKLTEISERLGTVEITYEEEKQALIREVEAKKKKVEELYNQINNITATTSEKEIKVESPRNSQPVVTQDEITLRKTTSYNASISILEKSVRSITEIFYDKFRNTAYFSQQELIDQLKQKFGNNILTQGELSQDNKDFIIKQFEEKFLAAEEHFLTKNIGSENEAENTAKNQQNKKSILSSLDKNFDILKVRLNKARDISDIQQTKMSDQDERDASKIVDDIINGALTDSDETVNRQLIALKKIMLKYKATVNPRASIDMSQKQTKGSASGPANANQKVKQKIESTLSYIQENMQSIKGQMKTYLSEDMRRTLKSKIVEWKQSQEDKKEVMKRWSLQSQNMWFTLIWHDSNDLDLVVKCPCGYKIYYGTKKCEQCGTYLEIDMNAGGNKNDKYPVEHIYLQKQPKVGSNWEVYCKMFHCNNNKESLYTIQIEHEDGRIVSYQGTLDINENPQSPIYKYTVAQGIDENEKQLINKIRTVIDLQEEFHFF